MNKKVFIVILALILIASAFLFYFLTANRVQAPQNQFEQQKTALESVEVKPATLAPTSTLSASQPAIVRGEITCLPRKDKESPAITLCFFGLKGDDGFYYALQDAESQNVQNIEGKGKVVVKGIFTPVEMLSSDIGKTYDIVGIIKVSSIDLAENGKI